MRVLSLSKTVNMLFIAPGDSLLRREAGHHDAEENSSSFAAGKGFSLSLLLNTPFEVSRFGQLFENFFLFPGVFPPFRHFEKFANDGNGGPRQRGKKWQPWVT